MSKLAYRLITLLALSISIAGVAQAESITQPVASSRQVDVVIALDVSGSMSGLIDSAKQRLWDIVNELGRAQPQPDLRLAILTYGNPSYGAQSGYVRIDLPFTRDLDAVNQTLFGFGTDGGDEYVARVVTTAVQQLDWSDDPDALKIVFVAGNEGAAQDPQISIRQATLTASTYGIVINTIYCGSDNDGEAAGWRNVASMADGLYASINQDAAAVAAIATPMDKDLAELNVALNDTYVAYGKEGDNYKENQQRQDANSSAMSPSAVASRTVTKASKMYSNNNWDLVDAVEAGADIKDLEAEELPEELKELSLDEREAYVQEKSEKRAEIKQEIQKLDRDRRDYISEEKSMRAVEADSGLDDAIKEGLRSIAAQTGFTFEVDS
jgi:hypothetical protein